jgi:phosphoribosyl-AMP cyclohydrolase
VTAQGWNCKSLFDLRLVMAETRESGPDFSKGDGLLPVVVQDAQTGEVLMLAYMNAESYAQTLAAGEATYYSRSRKKLWRKGEESGNIQKVKAVYVDCDRDTILLSVEQLGGAACHEGYKSCFFRQVTPEGLKVVAKRVFDPEKVYKGGQKSEVRDQE